MKSPRRQRPLTIPANVTFRLPASCNDLALRATPSAQQRRGVDHQPTPIKRNSALLTHRAASEWDLALLSRRADSGVSARDGKQDAAVAGSLVDVIVGGGDLGERVKGRNGNLQCARSRGRAQILPRLLFGLRREIVTAKQP
jgi:hypothetical protein